MTIRAALLVACLLASPATAAVYEVGEDGSVERLDVVVAPPTPVAHRASPLHTAPASARARALAPLVAAAADRYELSPALVNAIAHVESRYDSAAVSPAHAVGIMQLMPATARQLGVVDRLDPAANIRGGTAYLRQLLNRFDGDLVRTIAAYNAGPGAVLRARGIPAYPETVSYVSLVLDRMADAAN